MVTCTMVLPKRRPPWNPGIFCHSGEKRAKISEDSRKDDQR